MGFGRQMVGGWVGCGGSIAGPDGQSISRRSHHLTLQLESGVLWTAIENITHSDTGIGVAAQTVLVKVSAI